MKITTDQTTKVLLALVAIGLWGLLLRPLFVAGSAQAQNTVASPQGQTSALPLSAPVMLEAKEGVPYIVLSEGHISVWYVRQKTKLDPKTLTARKIEENTGLLRADSQPLPGR